MFIALWLIYPIVNGHMFNKSIVLCTVLFVADKSSGLGKLTSSTKGLTQHCWSKMQSLGEIVCLLFASNQICLLRFSNLLVMVALKKKRPPCPPRLRNEVDLEMP